ncbi:MAG: aminopeptidase P family protein [Clostridia bacterium]|nr:aminopeptidase P family protein [Clostridia bacterium]
MSAKRTDKIRSFLADGEGVIISGFPNIFYYSGFTSEDAFLVITKDRQILATDFRYIVQAKKESPDFEIYDVAKGVDKLFSGIREDVFGFEENVMTVSEFAKFQHYTKKLVPMSQKLSMPRRLKDSYEIEKIAKAEELAKEALSHTLSSIKVGVSEREVAREIEFYMLKNGAKKTSFETIVASGVRSCMPHGVASDKIIEAGDFVTIDFGCVLDGYCSDMTRTFVVSKATDRQREIYETVLNAQLTAISAIEVGKSCAEIDKAARDIIEKAGYGKNFGHSLGHSVGIEIHESPDFSPKSADKLESGNVITVEPGIYIDGFGGVRIEDVVVIGEKTQNLTNFTKELMII